MNDLAMNPLFVASAGLAGAGLVVALLLRLCRIHSPLWHRLGWGIVLAQGVLIISIPVSLPVLEARTPAPGWGDASQNEWRADLLAMDGARPAVAGNEIAAGVESRADSQRRISMATVYLAGLLLALVIQAGAYGALCLAMRRTREAPPEWQEEWKRILGERGIRNRVRLRVHDTIGPMVCRLPQGSRIVVPEQAWARLNARQRMAVLEHEAAHLLRGDVWKSFAARLVAVLHWFNPVAWWFAHHPDGTLGMVVAEVTSTFGDRSLYVLDAPAPGADGLWRAEATKALHVSPFLPVDGLHYDFAFLPPGVSPGVRVLVRMRVSDDEGPLLDAVQDGRRRPLDGRGVAGTLARHPVASLAALGAIHGNALRLWRKGAPFHRRPAPPGDAVRVRGGGVP